MTQRQLGYKKQLIQKIQTNKSNVFVDDESRKDFMQSRFGVDSTTKMNIDQLNLLLNYCLRKVSDIPIQRIEMITRQQIFKINQLWEIKAKTQTPIAKKKFIIKISQKDITDIEQLTKTEATKVIIALNKMV